MNLWAAMLADLPALGQRQIARFNRVSLPRGCSSEQRLGLLRSALCHQATVRAAYTNLDTDARAALHHLCAIRGGVSPAELQRCYGRVRSWRQIAADLRPQSIAERLLLHGWLLPRPPAPRHPPRWIVPPEVRRWLPRPLDLPAGSTAPSAPPPLALRVATTLLLLCNEQPQQIRADTSLRWEGAQTLAARLVPYPASQVTACSHLVTPLLKDLGLLTMANGTCATTPAGRRFLALSPAIQSEHLRDAWVAAPRADRWLCVVAPDTRGIDWPLLRRRLVAWSQALPADRLLDLEPVYEHLSSALGPLGDAHTHGFRFVDRAPWQPRRAAAVWQAAITGPLTWFGYVAHTDAGQIFRPSQLSLDLPVESPWSLLDDGSVQLPHADPDMLRLQPFAHWSAADAHTTTYRITPATLAHARSDGHDLAQLRVLLDHRAGPLEANWKALLEQPPVLSIADGTIVHTEVPALLNRAANARGVRRALGQRLAPGLALVAPDQRQALIRALQRQGIAVDTNTPPVPNAPSSLGFHPGECAVLINACVAYRRHAPDTETAVLDHLELRLRAAVPSTHPSPRALPPLSPEPNPTDPPLVILRDALVAQRPVRMCYTTENAEQTERIVRPLDLQRRGDRWYLRAYCTLRHAERTFLLDRISAVRVA